MTIGVISDTHDDVEAARKAVRILDSFRVLLTIHCGDVGLEVVPSLRGRRMYFVCGNMDDPAALGAAIVAPEHTFCDQFGSLELEGRRVAFLHGHDVKMLHQTVHSGRWDLVCHGHTHVFSNDREGRTLVLNPGALRAHSPSLAVVELPSLEVTEVPVY